MTQRMASRGSNGLAPLCVKDKRKARAHAHSPGQAPAPTGHTPANGYMNGALRGRDSSTKASVLGSGSESGSVSGPESVPLAEGSIRATSASPTMGDDSMSVTKYPLMSPASQSVVTPAPVVVERAEIIRLASQYTPCAGCSAAVKGLLQRPIEELRLVNAVMEEGCWEERRPGGGGGGRRNGKGGGARGGRGAASGAPGVGAAPADDWYVNGANGAIRGQNGGRDALGNGRNKPAQGLERLSQLYFGNTASGNGSSVPPAGDGPRALYLRNAYLMDRARLDQLLDTFPLEGLTKKVQPRGVGLRCEVHKRNGGQFSTDGWDWEDAWDRLPVDMRRKVASIDVDALETAMHQATSTHRFCADCKHNVVTAFEILTCKCDLVDIDNEEEYVPELFLPFEDRVGPVPGDVTGQKAVLSCSPEDLGRRRAAERPTRIGTKPPLDSMRPLLTRHAQCDVVLDVAMEDTTSLLDVEELIVWHENFDSRDYTKSSQRHAATLKHGQKEIKSIVGSVLLSQLRTNYQNHLAQVQAEQYLFALVLHAIRTRIDGPGRRLRNAALGLTGSAWGSTFGRTGPSACPRCGEAADPGCPICGGTGVSLSELGLDNDDADKKGKTKSKKKRERKARAKAAKKSREDNGGDASGASSAVCNGHSGADGSSASRAVTRSNGGRSPSNEAPHSQRNLKAIAQRQKGSRSGDYHSSSPTVVRGSSVGAHASRSRGSTGAGIGANKAQGGAVTSAARERAGSSGMETIGSLLSMLGGGSGTGECGQQEDEDGDDGIDRDLFEEMERLRLQKPQTDVQRSRAALRSNLQKNFDQLLVSSTSNGREAGERSR